jgi:predicted metal-binding membrane protein
MDHAHVTAGPATAIWLRRENLWAGLMLLLVTAVAWAYTLFQADTMLGMLMPAATGEVDTTASSSVMDDLNATNGMAVPSATANMGDMEQSPGLDTPAGVDSIGALVRPGNLLLFLFGWAAMMIAMMLPAALPLILLYRTVARKRLRAIEAIAGMVALLIGYVGIWTVVGLPVYVYYVVAELAGRTMAILPGLLLIVGGVYQFTALKQGCHTRCSNPLFFLMEKWQDGITGAIRLGMVHGIDCLGCCAGLMVALVALGMMQVAWMLTAAVIIFVEKTLPGGHRVARPLGVALVIGGVVVLGVSLRGESVLM